LTITGTGGQAITMLGGNNGNQAIHIERNRISATQQQLRTRHSMWIAWLPLLRQHGDSLATGAGDGQAADRDELGLLDLDCKLTRALRTGRSRKHYGARGRPWIGLDDNTIDFN